MPISKAEQSLRTSLYAIFCFVLTEEARSSKFSRGAATPEPAPIEPVADTKDKKKKKKGETGREYGTWLVNSYRFSHSKQLYICGFFAKMIDNLTPSYFDGSKVAHFSH